MAIKTFTTGEVLTAADTNTYLANAGLVYINNYEVSSGNSVTLTNCFPSGFTKFRIVLNDIATSADGGIFIQFTTTGVQHYGIIYYDSYVGTTGTVRVDNQQRMEIGLITKCNSTFDVHNPNVASTTKWHGTYFGREQFTGYFGGFHNVATAYSSCNILCQTGATFTSGSITVYGYRNP